MPKADDLLQTLDATLNILLTRLMPVFIKHAFVFVCVGYHPSFLSSFLSVDVNVISFTQIWPASTAQRRTNEVFHVPFFLVMQAKGKDSSIVT
jgi:hypothetical protein